MCSNVWKRATIYAKPVILNSAWCSNLQTAFNATDTRTPHHVCEQCLKTCRYNQTDRPKENNLMNLFKLNLGNPGSKRSPCLQLNLESKSAPKLQYPPFFFFLVFKLGNPHRLPLSCKMLWKAEAAQWEGQQEREVNKRGLATYSP